MPKVLWWGRSDNRYSRNRILVSLFSQLGWQVDFFHPASSYLGKALAFIKRPEVPDLIWVPCFRQLDVSSALFWSRKWKRPLVFDPLISAYQKEVFEKGKWRPADKAADRLRNWEGGLFRQVDTVIADTHLHAQFYIDTFHLDPKKVHVIYVGAEEPLFSPTDVNLARTPIEVLFYGSFLPLQGPEVIIDAARRSDNPNIKWVLLGNGDSKADLQVKSRNMPNVRFEPWIPYEQLPQRISRAHILMGIFGTTPKAAMVIPNKVFQSMAVGRPLITRRSDAYPLEVLASGVIGWVPAGDAQALSDQVCQMASNSQRLVDCGHQTRRLYETYFSLNHLRRQLQHVLDRVLMLRQ